MIMLECVVLTVCITAVVSAVPVPMATSGEKILNVKMKGAKPGQPDGYICASYEVPYEEAYIVKYEPMADADTAHHILMYGCDGDAASQDETWNCPPMCKNPESQKIIFAWAKNAPPAVLPQGVGFKVGRKSTIKTVVLQIHYAKSFADDEEPDYSGIRVHLTEQRQPFLAGIYMLLANFFSVPANVPNHHVEASCVYNKQTSMYPFAYRTHAHALGTVITGYQFNGTFQMIGKGNPQWPQAFYPANAGIEVKPGEKLIARCTYNSTGRNRVTYVGPTGNDEMCNFYIMYYTNSSSNELGGECFSNQLPELVRLLPADSDVPLPPNPLLDEEAHGHHHHAGTAMTSLLAEESGSAPATTSTALSASGSSSQLIMDIKMKGAKPTEPDGYICTSYEVPYDVAYIVKYEAMADADTAHHILIYGCDGDAASQDETWKCPSMCKDERSQKIIFAWAKNAPPAVLPKGVGFKVGRHSTIKTIVLQIHYAKSFTADEDPDYSGIRVHLTEERQPYLAGIYLLLASFFAVPSDTPKYHVEASCVYNKQTSMYPFAYRTHAHALGTVITGYQFNGTFQMIGKGNPQWPQAFYPTNLRIEVKPGDKLIARCTYNSTGRHRVTFVGATGNDEMCNFYIMYYTNSSSNEPGGECFSNQLPELVRLLPADSDVPLPPNPLLDEEAHGHHHHAGMAMTSLPADESGPAPATTSTGGKIGQGAAQSMNQERSGDGRHRVSRNVWPHISQEKFRDFKELPLPSGRRGEQYVFAAEVGAGKEQLPDRELLEQMLDSLGPMKMQKRLGSEYYDDYAANDERDDGELPDDAPGLSRNRNKAFEAMNQELHSFQHIKPHTGLVPGAQWPHGASSSSRKKDGSVVLGQVDPSHPLEPLSGVLQFQSEWPAESVTVGQVAGVATDKDGNVYVFHRGDRIWNSQSFDFKHNFQFQNIPIMEDTLVIFSREGKVMRKLGAGMFFMPHGITVDHHGNMWLTDVALHQVFRIPAGGTKPDLELGERFVHGDDSSHFCKPSDVAVLTSGDFFVSDGYCNSRVMRFSKDGMFIKEWGAQSPFEADEPAPVTFDIPHSITVAEDLGLVCVADRENGRIQCFDLQGGFVRQIKHKEFGSRLFAIEYCSLHGGLFFAVNGHSFEGDNNQARGFTIDARSGSLLEQWSLPPPRGLHTPHDVTVDSAGHSVYVGELSPTAVWKFSRLSPNSTHQLSTAEPVVPAANSNKETVTQMADKKNDLGPGNMDIATPVPIAGFEGSTKQPATKEQLLKTLTDEAEAEKAEEEELSDFTPSIIIGVLLVIPVVLLLVITLVLRMHSTGRTTCFSGLQSPKVFSLQGLLGSSHKGFDKLSQDDSDHEADVHSDSDHEEFRQPPKVKSKA